jgi:hypothetical protein
MFFLLRVAVWLSIVVMLIPADPQNGSEAPRVSVVQAFMAARATIADLSAFCQRNPDVCVTGNAAAQMFGDKAESGVRLLYKYLNDAGTAGDGNTADKQGTLTPDDMQPTWRGKGSA